MPAALIAFLESHDYEDAVRNAISLGGDADTLACITGAVAEAHYGGVPFRPRWQRWMIAYVMLLINSVSAITFVGPNKHAADALTLS